MFEGEGGRGHLLLLDQMGGAEKFKTTNNNNYDNNNNNYDNNNNNNDNNNNNK